MPRHSYSNNGSGTFFNALKTMQKAQNQLPWLDEGEDFPAVEQAWGESDPAPGLLAAGGRLDALTLRKAYSHGIFPWFSKGQPILWWSPSPRMVLQTANFRLHRSLRKVIQRFTDIQGCELRMDSAFEQVILACSNKQRRGQSGTWIVPGMVDAYIALHRAGHAHSVETWVDGQLVGGLYCVNLGRMVFGESMFAHQTDASKIALAALVAFCREKQIPMIDCQQNTPHLASLGAAEISRQDFSQHLEQHVAQSTPDWRFETLYWRNILSSNATILP